MQFVIIIFLHVLPFRHKPNGNLRLRLLSVSLYEYLREKWVGKHRPEAKIRNWLHPYTGRVSGVYTGLACPLEEHKDGQRLAVLGNLISPTHAVTKSSKLRTGIIYLLYDTTHVYCNSVKSAEMNNNGTVLSRHKNVRRSALDHQVWYHRRAGPSRSFVPGNNWKEAVSGNLGLTC